MCGRPAEPQPGPRWHSGRGCVLSAAVWEMTTANVITVGWRVGAGARESAEREPYVLFICSKSRSSHCASLWVAGRPAPPPAPRAGRGSGAAQTHPMSPSTALGQKEADVLFGMLVSPNRLQLCCPARCPVLLPGRVCPGLGAGAAQESKGVLHKICFSKETEISLVKKKKKILQDTHRL